MTGTPAPSTDRLADLRAALRAYALHVLVMLPALACSRAFLPVSHGGGYWPGFLDIDNWLVNALNKWDSAWYLDIAYRGYNRRSAAFFPLYPWLIRVVNQTTGLSLPVAAILLANLTFVGALCVLHHLVREERDVATAGRAVFYLALFPTSLFFSAGYTESLFLLFVVGGFLLARRGNWTGAALAGALAALTRNLGVFLLPVLGLASLERAARRRQPLWPTLREALPLGLIPAALGLHMLGLYRGVGEPLAFLGAQRFWMRTLTLPTATLWRGLAGPVPEWSRVHTVIDLLFAVGFLWLLWRGWRILPWSEWLFLAVGLVVPLSSLTPFAPLTSLPRYVAVLFPGFTVLASLVREEETHFALSLFFATGLAVATMLFASFYWVA